MDDTQRWGPPWRHDRRSGRFTVPGDPGALRHRGPGVGVAVFAGIFHVVGANNLAREGGVFVALSTAGFLGGGGAGG